jgi:hypothetical protein
MALSGKQKSVVGGALVGLAGAIALVTCAAALSVSMLEASLTGDRLSLLAACLVSPTVCLTAAIAKMANHRFSSTDDIDAAAGGDPTTKARILTAILQNTGEQTVLAALVYTIAAVLLPASLTDAIAYAAVSFLIGRVLFTLGYEGGAGRRGAGFALTFYPTIILGLLTAIATVF